MTFDGVNFSGNHQFCKTTRLPKPFEYRLDCSDLMTTRLPDAAKPTHDHDTFLLSIRIHNPRTFSIDGQQYRYCRGLE